MHLFLLVIGLYYVFYLPVVINSYVEYSWKFYGLLISEIIVVCDGIVTPLVYTWHSDTFKQKILEMYGLRKKDTKTHRSTISS